MGKNLEEEGNGHEWQLWGYHGDGFWSLMLMFWTKLNEWIDGRTYRD